MPEVVDAVAEAYRRFGLQLRGRSAAHEWHSACPFCKDGRDRFVVFELGNYFCRVCGRKGWLNEDRKTWTPPEDWRQRAEEATRELERKRQQTLKTWQGRFNSGLIWRWHDAMPPEAKADWLRWGISEANIEAYALGWRAQKRVFTPSGSMTLAAHTIPVTDPRSGEVVNIQYRLAVPPGSEIGKYRQEAGIPAAAFYASQVLEGSVIVVEGAKKAIVVSQAIGYSLPVVGMPSNVPHPDLLRGLDCFEEVFIAFDPGSDNPIRRAVRLIGSRARIVRYPGKPDDLVVGAGWTGDDLLCYLRFARKE